MLVAFEFDGPALNSLEIDGTQIVGGANRQFSRCKNHPTLGDRP
jgi:hypothetical protein